jgi:prophage regulatory protein
VTLKLIYQRELEEKLGKCRQTIHRWERAGNFPRRRLIGKNSVAWIESEVDAWIESRDQAGGKKPAQAVK